MTFQLREYAVKPGEMVEWLEEWRSRIVPRGLWPVLRSWARGPLTAPVQFVWIIGYDGPKSWHDCGRTRRAILRRPRLD